MMQPRWAAESLAAQHANVSPATIRRWREQGRIAAHKVGRLVRYDLNEIDQMLAASITRNGGES